MAIKMTLPINSSEKYLMVLLYMMGEVKQISYNDVFIEFYRRYSDSLLEKDKIFEGESLDINIWFKKAYRELNHLIKYNCVERNDHDILSITASGLAIIQENKKDDLAFDHHYRTDFPESIGKKDRKNIAWDGLIYHFSYAELFDEVRGILRSGVNPDIDQISDWVVKLDNHFIFPKWLFSFITGAEYKEFTDDQARKALSKIGFEMHKITDLKNNGGRPDSNTASKSWILDEKDMNLFYPKFGQIFPDKLQPFCNHGILKIIPNLKYIQIKYPEFVSSHYGLLLKNDEFSFQFFSNYFQENISHLNQAKEFEESWKEKLDSSLVLAKWGKKKAKISLEMDKSLKAGVVFTFNLWGGLVEYIEGNHLEGAITHSIQQAAAKTPSAPVWEIKAEAYADLMAKFINITYRDLLTVFPAKLPRSQAKSIPRSNSSADETAYRLLDEKKLKIRNFLEGRSVATPSQEELCDWIQLCYFFWFFDEGHRLFHYVNEDQLNNDWLYRRTKKYAKTCYLKVAHRSEP